MGLNDRGKKCAESELKVGLLADQPKGRRPFATRLKSGTVKVFRSVKGFLFPIPPEELVIRTRGVATTTITTSSTTTIITTKARSTTTTHTTTITATTTTVTTFKCVTIKPAVVTTTTTESVIPSANNDKFSKTTKTTTMTTTTTTTNIDPIPKITTTITKTRTRLPPRDAFLEIMVKVLKPKNP
ncbi:salivary glue protein Sgs-3-like [Metopolophium dirhodum]|uniref:salivary glue protein Sgs-3-like n=1 Tax=Metopolophium dirhodum TaxID=44670 RepID=UPI0029906237|nr:salivary glue protein Sgs-3-like [Metopolophium dirhodum]XP_060860204.1 salivary glue protein Sgs-3-like [Metopolophium dirhodum]